MTIRDSWWAAEERAEKIDRMTALFGKKPPKIKVRTDFQSYRPFCEKLRTQAVGGNPPDVFQNAVAFLRKYDKRGILLDLKSRMRQGDLSLGHFRAGVTAAGEADGKQPGIPRRLPRTGSASAGPIGCPAGGRGGAPSHGRRRSPPDCGARH
ncbi:extracellular solute-binding protein [Streptomyces sp. NPDC004014]